MRDRDRGRNSGRGKDRDRVNSRCLGSGTQGKGRVIRKVEEEAGSRIGAVS